MQTYKTCRQLRCNGMNASDFYSAQHRKDGRGKRSRNLPGEQGTAGRVGSWYEGQKCKHMVTTAQKALIALSLVIYKLKSKLHSVCL